MNLQLLALATMRGLLMRQVWEANRAALAEDILTNADMKTLVLYIGELHEQRERDLTPSDLRLAIDAKYRRPDGRKEELLALVDQLEAIEPMTYEEIQPHISDYLGRELAAKAATYISSREESENYDLRYPLELLERANELADGMNLDVEDMDDAPPPDALLERQGIATVGLGPEMDEHLGGGVGNGEMLIWLAASGVGKTSYLINQSVCQAQQGEHVLHITLEIAGSKVRQRIDQKLTGLTRDERLASPKLVMAARKSLAGKIYVKDWCDRDITVDDIRTLVRSMRAQGMEVTSVNVDYLELIVPVRANRHGARFDHSLVGKSIRKLANELGVKLQTAWQVNRAGSGKYVIAKEDVSECWDIVKHADIIIGLNQNEAELESKTLRAHVLKQRESTARPLEYYYSDMDRMVIRWSDGGCNDEHPREVGAGN